MNNLSTFQIDVPLVRHLVAAQFPEWADLSIKSVDPGGWDNRTFRLGDHMLVRLPSAAEYADKVAKEQYWLPQLGPHLPLPIPTPLAIGKPDENYPFPWSVYQWIDGETASSTNITDLNLFAVDLAQFLKALQHINTTDGPIAGTHNFYRGGSLKIYDAETQEAIASLGNKIDASTVTKIWNAALASTWQHLPVWVHGDIAPNNLLVKNGKLCAVIDFGGLGIGDPACDYAIAWTFFKSESRKTFRATLSPDNATWERARGWALWKGLITYAQLPGTNVAEKENAKHVIDEIIKGET